MDQIVRRCILETPLAAISNTAKSTEITVLDVLHMMRKHDNITEFILRYNRAYIRA
jgi:hypothetical protein